MNELCSVNGCGRVARHGGLCKTHYTKKMAGKDIDVKLRTITSDKAILTEIGVMPVWATSTVNQMTEGQIGWMAGIFDGEGSVCDDGKNGVRLQIEMTDQDTIEKVKEFTGVGNISVVPPSKDNYQIKYKWRVGTKEDVITLINLILPWMSLRRTERMKKALDRLSSNRGKLLPIKHGTFRGARREKYYGLEPCDDCREAEKIYLKEYNTNRRPGR